MFKIETKAKLLILAPAVLALAACGGGTSSSSNSSGTTTPSAPTNVSGSVSVSGTVQVGETLTSAVSDGNGTAGSVFVYQWLRAGSDISGATSSAYAPVVADVGSTLSLNVTYTDADGFAEDVTSSTTGSVAAAPASNSTGAASVSGTVEIGQTLTASFADANGITGSTPTYQWQADSADIAGATASTFEITDTQAGAMLRVIISYTDDDGFSEAATSAATVAVPAAPVAQAGGNFPRGALGEKDTVPAINCDTVYTSTSSLENAATRTISAGTTLCLADGTYSGLELDFGGAGTEALPITVAAENAGGAVIGGDVSVRMSGEYAVLQGLVFKDGQSASSDFLQTRNGSGEFCNNCRITEVAIIDLDNVNADSGKWLNIYGQDNRVDHSWFSGKTNVGALLVINREIADGTVLADVAINRTSIDHNYFGNRAPRDGKAYAENTDNDFEAIRLGTSEAHALNSDSVVEYNYFERIEGEAEVISNKSGNNRISNNTIRDSYGSLTTRHGSSATISNNFILGDGHPFAGGIRIIDDGHRVVNNYIEGARYLNTRFHGGIVIHNSDGSTTNGYQDVTNVLIANNSIVDSVNSLNVNGGNQSTNPENVFFVNNIIDDAVGPIITQADEGMPAGSTFAGNYVDGVEFSDTAALTSVDGFLETDPALIKDALGVSRPDPASGVVLNADVAVSIGAFSAVTDDMDGQARSGSTLSGSDEVLTSAAATGVLTFDDVGPIGYRPGRNTGAIGRVAVANAGFDAGTSGWSFTSPAVITAADGEYFSRKSSAKVDHADARVSQSLTVAANTNYTLSAFAKGPVKLGVDVGGAETGTDSNNSDYRFSSHGFNSGSNTSVTIFAELDDAVSNSVAIGGADFTDFTGNTSDADWTVIEQSGTLGQVQSTGNSASGADGALKFRLNDGSGETGGMGVTQELTGITPNTDYTLSAYVLYKRDRTDVTATIGVYEGGTTTVLASKLLDYAELEAAGAEESALDDFLLDSFTFNSGSQTDLTLFVTYTVNDVLALGGTQSDTELWVDDIALEFEGAPSGSADGFVDDFRVISHPQ